MRILIVSQYFWPEDFKVNDIAWELAQRGHEVTVFTSKPNYPKGRFYDGYGMFKKKAEVVSGIKIIRAPVVARGKGGKWILSLNYLSFVFFSFFTFWFRVRGNFDVVFAHLTSPITAAFPAIWSKKRFDIPLILWILDLWPESVEATTKIRNAYFYKILNKIVHYVYSNADSILISSKNFEKSIKKRITKESIKIEYFPNWAEDVFISKNNIQQKLPDFPKGFNIMFAGNIGEAQDFEAITRAAKIVKDKGINWIIIGDGRKYSYLEKVVEEEGINNIFLFGRHELSKMPAFFKEADAMLVSLKDDSVFELTVPAKIQSYMASKKIILAMINGEANRLIEDSGCGLVCAAGDYEKLAANALVLSTSTEEEKSIMEQNALDYYHKNFSKTKLINQLEHLLGSHAKRGSKN